MSPAADRMTLCDRWPVGSPEPYLLAIGEPYVAEIAARPGVSIVERRGDAVLFEKPHAGF